MKNRENKNVKKEDIYEQFIIWTAMPPTERYKLGIETQQEFSKFYGISINTPTTWKGRSDFQVRVTAYRKEWAFEKTSIVIESILRSAAKGNPASQRLWLQYFNNFPNNEEKETPKVILHHNDLRYIIDGFPEEARAKYYDLLRQIIDAAVQYRDKGLIKKGHPSEPTNYNVSIVEDGERLAREEEEKKKMREFLSNASRSYVNTCDSFTGLRNGQAMSPITVMYMPGALSSTCGADVLR